MFKAYKIRISFYGFVACFVHVTAAYTIDFVRQRSSRKSLRTESSNLFSGVGRGSTKILKYALGAVARYEKFKKKKKTNRRIILSQAKSA